MYRPSKIYTFKGEFSFLTGFAFSYLWYKAITLVRFLNAKLPTPTINSSTLYPYNHLKYNGLKSNYYFIFCFVNIILFTTHHHIYNLVYEVYD